MEEIKSVRVRRVFEGSSTLQLGTGSIDLSGVQFDIKVTIYKESRKRSLIGFNQNGSKVWDKIEYRDRGRYSDFSDDDLIKDFISVNSKREGGDFEIIQDPYLDKPPKERSFGFDPYYLNNGSTVLIDWMDGNFVAGGKSWSDFNGNELNIEKGKTQSTKGFITKTVSIWSPSSYTGENKRLMLTGLGIKKFSFEDFDKKFSGNVNDKDIMNNIISFWKTQVPNYTDLALCEPNNEFCELIDFINPADELEETEPVEDNKLVSEDPIADDKIKLSFEIDSNLKIKPREDFSFKLFIGEPPEDPNLAGFDFGDDEQDLSLLDDEFIESDFQGLSEEEIDVEFQLSKEQDFLINVNGSLQGGSVGNNGDPDEFKIVELTNKDDRSWFKGSKIERMLQVALGEKGYTEMKNTNLKPEPKKDTKYGKYWDMNGHHYCGMFVGWCAEKAGMKAGYQKIDQKQFGNSIYCPNGVNEFKQKDAYISNGNNRTQRGSSDIKPKAGWVVYFSWNQPDSRNPAADHVGIVVEDLGNGLVRCIEGNTMPGKSGANQTGSGVWVRDREKRFISGYGIPEIFDPSNKDKFEKPVK